MSKISIPPWLGEGFGDVVLQDNNCPYNKNLLRIRPSRCINELCFCLNNENEEQEYNSKISQHSTPLAIDTILANKYTIKQTLGLNPDIITYLAWDNKNSEKVIIKEYFPDNLVTRSTDSCIVEFIENDKKDSLNRKTHNFYVKYKNLAHFNENQNIVTILDVFEENGTSYSVMEFIDGITLEQALTQRNSLTMEETLGLLFPVAEAINMMHNSSETEKYRGMYHMAINPSNIMITANGNVKLMDFGRTSFRFNFMPNQKNNFYYASERFLPCGEENTWTDVYSLAAIIYRCITGVEPATFLENYYSLILKQDEALKPPSILGINLVPEQERVLLRGLELYWEDRYSSVKEFYIDLIESGDVTLMGKLKKFYKKLMEFVIIID